MNWISLGLDRYEEISAVVTVQTSVVEDLKIPVSAKVVKPQIFSEEIVDFGGVQVGTQRMHSLELHNPFEETIFFNLFIGRVTNHISTEAQAIEEFNAYKSQVEILQDSIEAGDENEELAAEMEHKVNQAFLQNQNWYKLARLPDLFKYCKKVRAANLEESSPAAIYQKADPLQSSQKLQQEVVDFEQMELEARLASIPSGVPFEIELSRLQNNQYACDILWASIAIVPYEYLGNEAWQTVNSFFATRSEEDLR